MQWIATYRNDIGELAGFDGSDLAGMTEEVCSVRGRGLDGLHRGHSILHHEGELLGTGAVRANAEIRTERHFDSGGYRFAKVLAMLFAEFAIMLKEIGGNRSLLPCFLNALFVVDIHVEIGSMLLGKGNAFVVDQSRMFDGSYARTNCVLDSLGVVGVRFHSETEVVGFVDDCLQFLEGELSGVRAATVREDCSGGENFDVVDAVVRERAGGLSGEPPMDCLLHRSEDPTAIAYRELAQSSRRLRRLW